jgi:hypothetical protein
MKKLFLILLIILAKRLSKRIYIYYSQQLRIVNKNKDGVILSNGFTEIQVSWKDVKESFHVIDRFYLIPNVKQQMELLDIEKKMEWFQNRFVSVMNIYSIHRTGSEPNLIDMYGVGELCQRYQEEHNSTPLEFVQALRDYFKYLDQMLHYSALRWK